MKVKTSDLIGKQLDWAVAEAYNSFFPNQDLYDRSDGSWIAKNDIGWYDCFEPSTSWGFCGTTIEDEQLVVYPDPLHKWIVKKHKDTTEHYGDTPLIAICRWYVASIFGDEVDITEFNEINWSGTGWAIMNDEQRQRPRMNKQKSRIT
jgi:hypothetical protein